MAHWGFSSKARSWVTRAAPLVVALLAACVTPESVARTRAANDFNCSEDAINITSIGGTSFRASGCDHEEVYDCAGSQARTSTWQGTSSGGTTNYVCIPERHHDSAEGEEKAAKEDLVANPDPDSPSGSPRRASLCVKAYQHIDDLTAAWGQWHSQRKAKSPPGKVEFLSVCHDLSGKQQMCLLMPYGRDYRVNCAKTLQALSDDLSQRLDDLFLEP
jgi:hypothetical protein